MAEPDRPFEASSTVSSPTPAERPSLPGYYLRGDPPTEGKRTIIIAGPTRTGTTFVASAVARLGVPFRRDARDRVSRRYEHRALRLAFESKDREAFREIVAQFDKQHDVWAWKLPAIISGFDFVRANTRNPCFILTFKEPLSVALRKFAAGRGPNPVAVLSAVLREYQGVVRFADSSDRPAMMVSYDRAVRRTEDFIPALANYVGRPDYDLATVIAGIRDDGEQYNVGLPSSGALQGE
jgi:hypothetical protein